MGRSKFPGKPSKHVNRKRINVLPPTADTNTEYSAAPAENLAEKCQVNKPLLFPSAEKTSQSELYCSWKMTRRLERNVPL